jgi:uncharacterized protein YndB with AHSA1/START domain
MIAAEVTQAMSLSRLFRGSQEAVFQAWTDPEELAQWWCPPGFSGDKFELDVRLGGRYRYSMRRDSDGTEVAVYGEYLAVQPPELLQYSWNMDGPGMEVKDTRVTVRFEQKGDNTLLSLTHEHFASAEMQHSHVLGWTGCLDRFSTKRGSSDGAMFRLAEELREARRRALKELAGLNQAQWSFRESPDRWSIAEITEHIADSAAYGHMIVERILAEGESGLDLAANDDALRAFLLDRSRRFPTSNPPAGVESMPEARSRFVTLIDRFATFVEQNSKDLRKYAAPSPAGTEWDGHQWVIGMAGHTLRHVDQIREVKAAPGYPS